ncbi:MAG: NAD(P)/FAD-dependent oxidoreductase [Candidatus Cryptobacteroides sp.]
MHHDIIIIGGGAAGLMAAIGARKTNPELSVLVLEKMPRPGRKIVITGKGRCNFTNLKDWGAFAPHVRANSNVLRASFQNLTPQGLIDFFENEGLPTVVERGDRAFPESHKSMDVVDTLLNAANKLGARIRTGAEVVGIAIEEEYGERIFSVALAGGDTLTCSKLILATGGLSYPATGSTGDGYKFAESLGLALKPHFPSLTALVPRGYKNAGETTAQRVAAALSGAGPALSAKGYAVSSGGASAGRGHIDRSSSLSETGKLLCGIQLKNVGVSLLVNGNVIQEMEGDLDFTDGGIEGPAGFNISRNAVKSIINGGKVSVLVNLKPGVPMSEFRPRVEKLWDEVRNDPRSNKRPIRHVARILLGKLMPWELTQSFLKCNSSIIATSKGREMLKINALIDALTAWRFDIEGYVGYERCVVTAGGVSCDEVVPKTLESRKIKGLYLCGELLDLDADTGGYNLQIAFSTGYLAGQSAAR